MRQEFINRLRVLRQERNAGSWRDGWIYGRLKQDFDLQPDELNEMTAALGFKHGWNSFVKDILENQWQKDEVRWELYKRDQAQSKISQKLKVLEISEEKDELLQELRNLGISRDASRTKLTEVERVLIGLILRMRVDEQSQVLSTILNRYRI